MEKIFDCLKMKEEIQAKIYKETKDMTFPELDIYFNKSLENNVFWKNLADSDHTQRQMKRA